MDAAASAPAPPLDDVALEDAPARPLFGYLVQALVGVWLAGALGIGLAVQALDPDHLGWALPLGGGPRLWVLLPILVLPPLALFAGLALERLRAGRPTQAAAALGLGGAAAAVTGHVLTGLLRAGSWAPPLAALTQDAALWARVPWCMLAALALVGPLLWARERGAPASVQVLAAWLGGAALALSAPQVPWRAWSRLVLLGAAAPPLMPLGLAIGDRLAWRALALLGQPHAWPQPEPEPDLRRVQRWLRARVRECVTPGVQARARQRWRRALAWLARLLRWTPWLGLPVLVARAAQAGAPALYRALEGDLILSLVCCGAVLAATTPRGRAWRERVAGLEAARRGALAAWALACLLPGGTAALGRVGLLGLGLGVWASPLGLSGIALLAYLSLQLAAVDWCLEVGVVLPLLPLAHPLPLPTRWAALLYGALALGLASALLARHGRRLRALLLPLAVGGLAGALTWSVIASTPMHSWELWGWWFADRLGFVPWPLVLGGALGWSLARLPGRAAPALAVALALGAAGWHTARVTRPPHSATLATKALLARAEAGDAPACRELAQRYAVGLEVDADLALAHAWLVRAAEGGDPDAMLALGRALELGRNCARDPEAARGWLARAAAADAR